MLLHYLLRRGQGSEHCAGPGRASGHSSQLEVPGEDSVRDRLDLLLRAKIDFFLREESFAECRSRLAS